MGNYSMACTDYMFVCFIILRPFSFCGFYGGDLRTLLTTGQGRSSNFSRAPICGSLTAKKKKKPLKSW